MVARGRIVVVLVALSMVAAVAVMPVAADTPEAAGDRAPASLELDWSAYEAAAAAPAGAGWAAVEADRISGANRLETAVAIAQRSFPSGADVAYLARADQFADSLAAGTLTDGPILLVPSCGDLPDVVADEIDRLDPHAVVALGGQAAVCGALLDDAAEGRDDDRVAGPNRYETAVAIAERGFADGAGTVYLASGDDSPDAVAGGVLTDGPILLLPANGDQLGFVSDTVAALDPDRVVALAARRRSPTRSWRAPPVTGIPTGSLVQRGSRPPRRSLPQSSVTRQNGCIWRAAMRSPTR